MTNSSVSAYSSRGTHLSSWERRRSRFRCSYRTARARRTARIRVHTRTCRQEGHSWGGVRCCTDGTQFGQTNFHLGGRIVEKVMDFPSKDVIIFFKKCQRCFDSWKTQVNRNYVIHLHQDTTVFSYRCTFQLKIVITIMRQQKSYLPDMLHTREYFWFEEAIIFLHWGTPPPNFFLIWLTQTAHVVLRYSCRHCSLTVSHTGSQRCRGARM